MIPVINSFVPLIEKYTNQVLELMTIRGLPTEGN